MLAAVEALLAAIARMPAVGLEVDEAGGEARVGVAGRRVARVELARERVVVDVPAERIAALHRIFPSSRALADGLAFDVADATGAAEALAAIRRRATVEQMGAQARLASP
jgi:hypothetical protein